MVHLLNKRYTPWYKWAYRSLLDMKIVPEAHALLGALCADSAAARDRIDLIEQICALVIAALKTQGLICGQRFFARPQPGDHARHCG
jgi:hypothetical protein